MGKICRFNFLFRCAICRISFLFGPHAKWSDLWSAIWIFNIETGKMQSNVQCSSRITLVSSAGARIILLDDTNFFSATSEYQTVWHSIVAYVPFPFLPFFFNSFFFLHIKNPPTEKFILFVLFIAAAPQRPKIEHEGLQVPPGHNVTVDSKAVATVTCVSHYGNPAATLKWFLGK